MELFEARGFDTVTVAEIAARAGVSSKTLFQHFGSKEELLVGELDKVHEELVAVLRTRDPTQTPLDAVTNWLIAWATERGPDVFDRFIRMVGSGPSVESMRRRLYEEWENAIVAVLADEANEARPTPVTRLTAAQLVSMIRVLTSPEQRAVLQRFPPSARESAYRAAVRDAADHLGRGLPRRPADAAHG